MGLLAYYLSQLLTYFLSFCNTFSAFGTLLHTFGTLSQLLAQNLKLSQLFAYFLNFLHIFSTSDKLSQLIGHVLAFCHLLEHFLYFGTLFAFGTFSQFFYILSQLFVHFIILSALLYIFWCSL